MPDDQNTVNQGDMYSPPPKLSRADKKMMQSMNAPAKKSKKGVIIVILVLVLLMGGSLAVFALDIAGIRTQMVMPMVRAIPIVGNFLPEVDVYTDDTDEAYTFEELQLHRVAANAHIYNLERTIQELTRDLQEAEATIRVLQPFQNNHQNYLYATAQWNRMIAHGDPIAFVEFFEHVREENIPQLLEEADALIAYREELMRQVRIFNNMDETPAGEILIRNLMIDSSLVQRWLLEMSPARIAEIFEAMDEINDAANLMMLLNPTAPIFAPIEAPPLPTPPPLLATPTPTTVVDGNGEYNEYPEADISNEAVDELEAEIDEEIPDLTEDTDSEVE